jgi:hypothetical protein
MVQRSPKCLCNHMTTQQPNVLASNTIELSHDKPLSILLHHWRLFFLLSLLSSTSSITLATYASSFSGALSVQLVGQYLANDNAKPATDTCLPAKRLIYTSKLETTYSHPLHCIVLDHFRFSSFFSCLWQRSRQRHVAFSISSVVAPRPTRFLTK